MNITRAKYFLIGVVYSLCTSSIAQAEAPGTDSTTLFHIAVEGGGGYTRPISTHPYSSHGLTEGGASFLLRVRWGSSNRVGLALESGYLPVSASHYTTDAPGIGSLHVDAQLSTIPLLLLFSLQRYGVLIHLGAGYYRLRSWVNVDNETTTSTEWDFGVSAGVGAVFPISDNVGIGAEIGWRNISEQQISLVSLAVRVSWRLVRW
ncbi:MAG: outer membrane beta-barrel protein [Ignavibacteriales bacterium]|nr:outer membrane beta-barrel protein [Ignavibacteriales bacterium]